MNERDFSFAQERQDAERAAGIDAVRQGNARKGLSVCACGEPITDFRRLKIGAVRCVECQQDLERKGQRK